MIDHKNFLCIQFVKIPKGTLPSISSLSVKSPTVGAISLPPSEAASQLFSVAAVTDLLPVGQEGAKPSPIPLAYQKLLKEFPEILTPNFKDVKHSVVHAIPTGDAKPIRSKARPLLSGSPKAQAGWAAWKQMIDLGIVQKVTAEEAQEAWSFPLHLQTKPDLT